MKRGLGPKATVYGSFHLRFPSRSLKAIMRNRPADCKRRYRIETGNLLLASLMVKNKYRAVIWKRAEAQAPTLYRIDDYRCAWMTT